MINPIAAVVESRLNRDPKFRVGSPTKEFWSYYKSNKDLLKEKGFYVFTHITNGNEDWLVKYPSDYFNEAPAKLAGEIPNEIIQKLKDYQRPHLKNMAQIFKESPIVHDGSDTGTGKTYVAAALCAYANLRPIVVCPLAVMSDWKKTFEYFGVKPLLIGNWEAFKGKNEFGVMDKCYMPYKAWKLVLENTPCPFPRDKFLRTPKEALEYLAFKSQAFSPQAIAKWEAATGKSIVKRMRHVRGFLWTVKAEGTIFILDEVQKAKGEESQNSRMAVACKGYNTLTLSATAGSTPRDFKALGYLLNLHQLNDFDVFSRNLGCSQNPFNGWYYAQKSNGMDYLSKLIYGDPIMGIKPKGVRMRISDIPDFPETLIMAVCYDAEGASKAQKEYKNLEIKIQGLHTEAELRKIVVAQITSFRRAAELAKLPLIVNDIEQALEENKSIVVFLNYKDSMDELEKMISQTLGIKRGVPRVDGGQEQSTRDAGIKAFQEDRERIILVNTQAGGAGLSLHDVTGKHPRLSLISPSYDPLMFHQIFGRVRRNGGKSKSIQKIIYLAGTIEEEVCKRVAKGLENLDVLNETPFTEKDLTPKAFQLMLESIKEKND